MLDCEECGETYVAGTSAWGMCRVCLDDHLSTMTPEELADVPGAVLRLFGRDDDPGST